MKKLLFLLATVGMIFTACEGGGFEEENGGTPSTPKIELSQQSVEVDFEAAQHSISITSPCSWEATAKNDWIEVIIENGIAGTKELKFSVERNEELEIREGTIVVKNDDYNLVAELYITQKAFVPAITIEPESLAFAVEGGTQEIAITANFEYKYSTNANWLTIKKSEKGISVTVPNYVEIDERTAEITISNEKYGISKVVKVAQGAFVPAITIDPETLTFAFEGGTQEVAITANFEYAYSANADWLTIEKSEKGISVTAPNYVEVENRTAEITISNEKYGVSEVVKVTQGAFVPEWSVSPESLALAFAVEGGTQEIVITANFEYKYSKNANWLTIEKSESAIKVTAKANANFEERTAEITISSEKYGISKTIAVTQKGVSAESKNVILYTSSDGKIVTPYNSDVFGANIVSNTYRDGQGIIIFNAPVTSIGDSAFCECSSLTSVTIGNSVTSIGEWAFCMCDSLTSVTIPDSVTSIGEGAFYMCDSLTSVTIPDSVTSIGEVSFYYCSNLTSVTIGNSVTSIGKLAFDGCSSLTSVTIPNSVTSIGNNAFYKCTSLKSITIPDSVTSIGEDAFNNCTSLTRVNITDLSAWCKIDFGGHYANPLYLAKKLHLNGTEVTELTIPSDITEIKAYAFDGCKSLTSVTIPDSVTSIGDFAFCECSSMTSVTIPNSVTSIGDFAFEHCSSLTSITIGNGVTSIGEWAFYDCSSLTSITIPDSVTSIGRLAFYNCSSLTSVYCKPTTPPAAGGYNMFDDNASGRKIYVPRNSVEAYKVTLYWRDYASSIEGYDF